MRRRNSEGKASGSPASGFGYFNGLSALLLSSPTKLNPQLMGGGFASSVSRVGNGRLHVFSAKGC